VFEGWLRIKFYGDATYLSSEGVPNITPKKTDSASSGAGSFDY